VEFANTPPITRVSKLRTLGPHCVLVYALGAVTFNMQDPCRCVRVLFELVLQRGSLQDICLFIFILLLGPCIASMWAQRASFPSQMLLTYQFRIIIII
jgi:hypothetical protein